MIQRRDSTLSFALATYGVCDFQLVLDLSRVLDDGFQVRQVGLHLEDLLHLHVVLDHHDVRLAVAHHVLARLRRVGRIDASCKATATTTQHHVPRDLIDSQ